MPKLRVKFADDSDVQVTVSEHDTLQDVAQQVRAAKGWGAQQYMRFIWSGQELHFNQSVAKISGVVHCVASSTPPNRYLSHKHNLSRKDGEQQPMHTVDWLEVVDPGTVLMWIFGSILALLWLLFVFYAHMFDKTSVVMLCLMTIAFLIPCVLSYVPCLRMLNGPISHLPPAQQPLYYYAAPGEAAPGINSQQQAAQPWSFGSSAAAHTARWGDPAYSSQIPPRPAPQIRHRAAAAPVP